MDTKYKIPSGLNDFQEKMYKHLIRYKWDKLGIKEAGKWQNSRKPGTFVEYDTMFPEALKKEHYPVYRPCLDLYKNGRNPSYKFKIHEMAVHMASSQVACFNLFVPLMQKADVAAKVLSKIKTDMKSIATDRLDNGYAIEFWNDFEKCPEPRKGLLKDHTKHAGTDVDFAIAYRDMNDDLCLWLIEHKLTEREFTTCGGYKSKSNKDKTRCDDIAGIIKAPDRCHYRGACGYDYWNITLGSKDVFPLQSRTGECPFKGGMNQLWRNVLLALAVQKSGWGYKNVTFSVVHHPENKSLDESMTAFKELLGVKDKFFSFTLDRIINEAKNINNADIQEWVKWYEELYLPGE